MEKVIQNLQNKISDPNFSIAPSNIMAPKGSESYRIPSKDASLAAVLICLYFKKEKNDYHFVLMKRREAKGDKHSGQISLPGGRFEKEDLDFSSCAKRETEEEIGIPRSMIKILGQLSDLYVYASNFMVYPFVGIIDKEIEFVPDPKEVQRIIEVSIKHLIDDKTMKYKDLKHAKGTIKNVPYYDIDGEVVWGATAMILSEFISYWKSAS